MTLERNRKRGLISVVIPALNEGEFLGRTLESVINQDCDNFEIIVVDNNSDDNTAEIAKSFGVNLISEPRRGVGFARQAGFLAARGEIIAYTDADSIVPKDWLARMVSEFKKHPRAVAISGMYDFYDGSRFLKFLTALFNYPVFVVFGWYSGANLAVKKDALIKVGGFDVNLTLSEDSDLCQRLRKTGEVYRLPFFKIKCSARRFNKLGVVGGLWHYFSAYFKIKVLHKYNKPIFLPVSDLKKSGVLAKVFYNSLVLAIFISVLFGIFYNVEPVKAKMIKSEDGAERMIVHNLTKIKPYLASHHFKIRTQTHIP